MLFSLNLSLTTNTYSSLCSSLSLSLSLSLGSGLTPSTEFCSQLCFIISIVHIAGFNRELDLSFTESKKVVFMLKRTKIAFVCQGKFFEYVHQYSGIAPTRYLYLNLRCCSFKICCKYGQNFSYDGGWGTVKFILCILSSFRVMGHPKAGQNTCFPFSNILSYFCILYKSEFNLCTF